jgi:hypothetical protein
VNANFNPPISPKLRFVYQIKCAISHGNYNIHSITSLITIHNNNFPQTFGIPMKILDVEKWMNNVQNEYNSLISICIISNNPKWIH